MVEQKHIVSTSRLRRWIHHWFWSSFAIVRKSFEKSALSKQQTGGENGTNRENYPTALDTHKLGFLGWGWSKPSSSSHICSHIPALWCLWHQALCSAMVPLPALSSPGPAGIPCHCFKLTVLYSCADPGFTLSRLPQPASLWEPSADCLGWILPTTHSSDSKEDVALPYSDITPSSPVAICPAFCNKFQMGSKFHIQQRHNSCRSLFLF